MERLAILGLVLTISGAILSVGFWPLASVSGAELLAAQSTGQYGLGSRVFIREKVVDIGYTNAFGANRTILELEDGDPGTGTYIFVHGDARPSVSPGSYYYFTATRASYGLGAYWDVASPAEIQPSLPIDALFFADLAIGVLLLAIVAFRKPAKSK